jgi:polyferredoxin
MSTVRTIPLPQLRVESASAPAAAQGPLLKPEGRVLATLEEDGRRRWIRPRLSPGSWWRRRRVVAWILIALYTVVPFTTWSGMPTVLLDLVERKFIFFGTVFRPTETLLSGLLFLSIFATIFLLTAMFGRVWCGWACPQTVYMEFVYRPLERFFLGRAALDAKASVAPWRRVAMYGAYLAVSAHLANTLLAWFVGAERLNQWIFTSPPTAHPVAFLVFAAVTLLMMFDFAFFREQLCSLVCPYGRLQSALLDRDSLIVGYDARRGEPRGKGGAKARSVEKKHGCSGGCGCDGRGGCGSGGGCDGKGRVEGDATAAACDTTAAERDAGGVAVATRGDCIDCTLCVQTCPAGIDIRDGLQLECIHCAQCIDACDAVMTKLGRPTGLIRYGSQRTLAGEPRRGVRMRLVVYPLLLAVLLTAFGVLLARREDAFVAVLRTQGVPYVVQAAGTTDERIESIVRMRIDNRAREARRYLVRGSEGVTLARDASVEVAGDASGEVDVVVVSRPGEFHLGRREVRFQIEEEGGRQGAFRQELETHVLGPLVLQSLGNPPAATDAEGGAR